jgi:hypothetical protein
MQDILREVFNRAKDTDFVLVRLSEINKEFYKLAKNRSLPYKWWKDYYIIKHRIFIAFRYLRDYREMLNSFCRTNQISLVKKILELKPLIYNQIRYNKIHKYASSEIVQLFINANAPNFQFHHLVLNTIDVIEKYHSFIDWNSTEVIENTIKHSYIHDNMKIFDIAKRELHIITGNANRFEDFIYELLSENPIFSAFIKYDKLDQYPFSIPNETTLISAILSNKINEVKSRMQYMSEKVFSISHLLDGIDDAIIDIIGPYIDHKILTKYRNIKFSKMLKVKIHENIEMLSYDCTLSDIIGSNLIIYNQLHQIVNGNSLTYPILKSLKYTYGTVDSYHMFYCYKGQPISYSVTNKLLDNLTPYALTEYFDK